MSGFSGTSYVIRYVDIAGLNAMNIRANYFSFAGSYPTSYAKAGDHNGVKASRFSIGRLDRPPRARRGLALDVVRHAQGLATEQRRERGAGRGVARRSLEQAARECSMRTLRLETGTLSDAALRSYARRGYERIPAFGPYVGSATSVCMARDLG